MNLYFVKCIDYLFLYSLKGLEKLFNLCTLIFLCSELLIVIFYFIEGEIEV